MTGLKKKDYRVIALIITFSAFFVRLVIAVLYENNYDTQWNLMWATDLRNGLFNAYDGHVRQLDYPPLYLFALKLVGTFTKSEAVSGFAPLRMLAIKFFPVLCDSLTCFVLYLLGEKKSGAQGILCCVFWALDPAAVFNCAFWGQTDCVMLLFLLVCFTLLLQKRKTAAAIVYALCVLLKFQTVYFAPVVLLELIRQYGGFRSKKAYLSAAKDVFAAVGVWVLVWIPFCIGANNALLPLDVYLGGADTYPYICLNADNVFGLFNLNWTDETTLSKVLSYTAVVGVYAVITAAYVRFPRFRAEAAALLAADGIFMLTTRQHERYQIAALIFFAILLARRFDVRILALASAQALLVLLNQSRVLALVNHAGDWAEHINTFQTVNSVLNIALFVLTVLMILKITLGEGEKNDGTVGAADI